MSVRGVMLFDFDGTVCLGDGPALAYARAAFAGAADADRARAERQLRRFLAGERIPPLDGCRDGYQAVATLAQHAEIASSILGAAFLRSREELASGTVEITAPEGLIELLTVLQGVVPVLATNSPGDTLGPILARLGLSDAFAEVIASANKPTRTGIIVDALLARHELSDRPDRLLSIGDIWPNDLEAPAARGCATVAIDPHGWDEGAPTLRVRELPEAYPFIRQWASGLE